MDIIDKVDIKQFRKEVTTHFDGMSPDGIARQFSISSLENEYRFIMQTYIADQPTQRQTAIRDRINYYQTDAGIVEIESNNQR